MKTGCKPTGPLVKTNLSPDVGHKPAEVRVSARQVLGDQLDLPRAGCPEAEGDRATDLDLVPDPFDVTISHRPKALMIPRATISVAIGSPLARMTRVGTASPDQGPP